MANDPNNIRLGPCRVRWGGVDLGLTKGGVDIETKTDTRMVQVDQFGDTPIDEYITGRTLTVKVPFAEMDMDSVYAMLKQSVTSLVDDGVKATGNISFTANPTASTTITVNGRQFKFVTAPTGRAGPGGLNADEIALGATTGATLTNAAIVINASSDPKVNAVTAAYSSSGGDKLTFTAKQSGTAGNSITLAASAGPTVTAMSGGTAGTHKRVEIFNGVGSSLLQTAAELVLHPQYKPDNDFTEDFIIPLANTAGNFTFSYKLNEERVFNLTFTGYPNPSTGLLAQYGNKY